MKFIDKKSDQDIPIHSKSRQKVSISEASSAGNRLAEAKARIMGLKQNKETLQSKLNEIYAKHQ